MKLYKKDLDVLTHASKDETRQALQSILVESGQTVATDGHRLAILTREDDGEEESFLLPVDVAKQIQKMIGRDVLTEIDFQVEGDKVKWTWQGMTGSFPKVDGKFPNYKQVVPADEERLEIGVNARFLKEACELALKTQGKNPMVKLSFKLDTAKTKEELSDGGNKQGWSANYVDGLDPIQAHMQNNPMLLENEDGLKIVLMPMRL